MKQPLKTHASGSTLDLPTRITSNPATQTHCVPLPYTPPQQCLKPRRLHNPDLSESSMLSTLRTAHAVFRTIPATILFHGPRRHVQTSVDLHSLVVHQELRLSLFFSFVLRPPFFFLLSPFSAFFFLLLRYSLFFVRFPLFVFLYFFLSLFLVPLPCFVFSSVLIFHLSCVLYCFISLSFVPAASAEPLLQTSLIARFHAACAASHRRHNHILQI